ncbi:ATP-binding protein [Kamptonema sp. UHCC 0994]|uniref:ATP-binding protein n=1 Tax=Kamptonema sp. UHCC 0994 TaxID=3031329 RepID=UPI0023B95971|nr:ATP-binding protein [Kamptonema sp. UHCC 0994]MDF0555770.1 sensor histidine kinase [Kamptonema sp. UHCC 0994]
MGSGTGLGMSIGYEIVVQKHGATLRCLSTPGQGAEFWIEIPLRSQSTLTTRESESIKG